MQNYLSYLLSDIADAIENISLANKESSLHDWLSDEDENRTASGRNLQEWTGIYAHMLPPPNRLNDEQIHSLLNALKKLLDTCNCCFITQTQPPERIRYTVIRNNFDQTVKIKRWHLGFFQLCKEGTTYYTCALGKHCECALFADLFSTFTDEELTPEEERKRALDIEVQHIKKKYDNDWMKYYPYHLDASYDDKYGNAYNYGFDEEEELCFSLIKLVAYNRHR